MIKFSKEIPSIYETLHKKFGVEWERGLIITYGETVYCNYVLDAFKIAHEATHVKQQLSYTEGVVGWWDRYLIDIPFRLNQELEAYQNEVFAIKATFMKKQKKAQLINQVCKDLSSYIYGNIISYDEARRILK